MYRLMFSDLDETLLVNHHVPKMNQEAILKAREQGLKFVPCTGRAFNMIPDILKEIGTYDKAGEYSLCFNGYRNEPATNALWFKNPGTNVDCPETFYGRLSGKYKKHCFYNPGLKDNCDL